MSMFILVISCLTSSNLPWFMDLTIQVPMKYCSVILLQSPVPPSTGCCLCFGSIPSFFLELFLHQSPVAYWAPTDLGSSSFSVLSFCLSVLFMEFLRQEYWSGLPFLLNTIFWFADFNFAISGFLTMETTGIKKRCRGTSLLVYWLRLHRNKQRALVSSLIWELDPTCCS